MISIARVKLASTLLVVGLLLLGCESQSDAPWEEKTPDATQVYNQEFQSCQAQVGKTIKTATQLITCRNPFTSKYLSAKGVDADLINLYSSELIVIAEKLDQKKISAAEYNELDAKAFADMTTQMKARENDNAAVTAQKKASDTAMWGTIFNVLNAD